MTEPSITPADIEARFRSIQGEIETVSNDSKKVMELAAAAGAILLVGVVYYFGRRAGKRKSTVLEIRRL
jgi:hypothetical protein